MYPKKDLEEAVLAIACEKEEQTLRYLVKTIFDRIGDPSKKTILRTINGLVEQGVLTSSAEIIIRPTAKARRELAKCQEDA
jgi:DNA-binding PadR family transcriptional regulator